MKIAYLYQRNAANTEVQSGRPASILRQLLSMGVAVEQIFPLNAKASRKSLSKKILYRLVGRKHRGDRDPAHLSALAAEASLRLERATCDVIFSPGSEAISALNVSTPITFCADATFANMVDYYEDFSRASSRYLRNGHAQESAALARASLAVYPSALAARSAIEFYGASPEKVVVIPFGANLGAGNPRDQVGQWIASRPRDRLRLLFVGRDWERKGGDLVVGAAQSLRAGGLEVELDLVGCTVPARWASLAWIRRHGLLSANRPDDLIKLSALFARAHFVFVPSRAEAYGMTFAEACAFGVPTISTDTGGIPSIVANGINGFLLPPEADAVTYASTIASAFADKATYESTASKAYEEFSQRLNWPVFCKHYLAAVERRCELKPARRPSARKPHPLRLAFVENHYFDSSTPAGWSGLPYFIRRCLENAGFEIVTCSLREPFGRMADWRRAMHFLSGKRALRGCDARLLRSYGRQLDEKLRTLRVDAVFSPSSWLIAHAQSPVPMFFWTDACFAGMMNFYESFSGLAADNVNAGYEAEHLALSRCAGAFYSSQWAADSAIRHHHADPAQVRVLPFGSNLQEVPASEEVAKLIAGRSLTPFRLLLVGVDWKRKGIDFAIEVVERLVARGCAARLTVVGCSPPQWTIAPDCVEVIPFVSKKTVEGRRQLSQLFAQSDLFILPSRAEAYGLALSEACAHGLPCLATDVGGISSIIESGVNGQLFPLKASADDYASYIIALRNEPGRYRQLARNAAHASLTRLNWEASSRQIAQMIPELIAHRESRIASGKTLRPPAHVGI